jgi:hypothetical protein
MVPSSAVGVSILQLPPPLPPPNGSVLTLLAALSNHNPSTPSSSTFGNNNAISDNNANNNNGPPKVSNHQLALAARDEALSSSPEGYGNLCVNFCRVLACPSPHLLPKAELQAFHDGDPIMFAECCGWVLDTEASESAKAYGLRAWNNIRQMAGLLLKNALVAPPLPKDTPLDALGRVLTTTNPGGGGGGRRGGRMELPSHYATEIKLGLLLCITDTEAGIRGTASTCIARCCTSAVHLEKSMKAFCIKNWVELIPFILQCIASTTTTTTTATTTSNNERGIKHIT